jgi:pyrroline-5-carboxylate reductase
MDTSIMLHEKTIGFIGAGNMGEALINGVLSAGLYRPESIFCSDPDSAKRQDATTRYGVRTSENNLEVIRQSDIIILAVKPQILSRVFQESAAELNHSKLIVSIAAGVPLTSLADLSREPLRLVRAMPNICVSVKAGATAVVPGKHATAEDMATVITIFNSVGRCVALGSEHLMDAVTGLSGSGPAYAYVMIEALADGGVKMGLGRQEALLLAAQTLMGAAQMHLETQVHPGELKDRVTSPGGTTIAGLHALEKGGLRGTLISSVEAATERSRVLGALPKVAV